MTQLEPKGHNYQERNQLLPNNVSTDCIVKRQAFTLYYIKKIRSSLKVLEHTVSGNGSIFFRSISSGYASESSG